MDTRPKKTVRFASFPPRTPSPASSTTLDSPVWSPPPLTPPQLFTTQPLPRVAAHDEYPSWQSVPVSAPYLPQSYPAFYAAAAELAMVDPLLEVIPHPALPPLIWDVRSHPDNIKLGAAYTPASQRLVHSDLARCAARSSVKNSRLPLRRMTLVFADTSLEADVTPSADAYWSTQPLPFVTVGDVLYIVYRTLRLTVSQDDFDRLPSPQRESLRRAFEARLHTDPRNYAKDVRYGVRRVDFLGQRRMFRGIRPATASEVSSRRRREDTFIVELGHA